MPRPPPTGPLQGPPGLEARPGLVFARPRCPDRGHVERRGAARPDRRLKDRIGGGGDLMRGFPGKFGRCKAVPESLPVVELDRRQGGEGAFGLRRTASRRLVGPVASSI